METEKNLGDLRRYSTFSSFMTLFLVIFYKKKYYLNFLRNITKKKYFLFLFW